jgi:DNA helicase-2/ATP-dependent DNA helicase PcrA
MDFDDLLLFTNVLFRDFPQVLEKYATRFSHILVDEYQDTNYAQYLIVKKMAQKHRNLCVVGDDAQSIYAFRGARIENILHFKQDFPDAKEYRLEQNYRSTQIIVQAANSVIKNNTEQLTKECFSKETKGEKIELIKAYTDQEEAYLVVASILARLYSSHASYDDFAILYRTNAQSRAFEESLRKRNIPHKIYGSFSFFERAEIKDMLAYLRLAVNFKDDEAFKRIINVPARGIGDTTIQRLQIAAQFHKTSLWEQIEGGNMAEFGLKPAAAHKLREFVKLIAEIAEHQYTTDAYDFALEVAKGSGYLAELKNDFSVEGRVRLENVEELFNSINELIRGDFLLEEDADTEDDKEFITIHSYLSNVALITDLEEKDDVSIPKVSLMTVHSAKGLEFKYVYVVGMEENLFPSPKSTDMIKDLEEERRLFYVALTRAKSAISLSFAQSRYRWGTSTSNPPSRFLKEIDPQWLNKPLQKESGSTTGKMLYERQIQKRPVLHVVPSSRSQDPSFVASDPLLLKVGQRVKHEKFGIGTIVGIEGKTLADLKAVVDFDRDGTKTLLLKFARMRIV